MCDMDVDGWLTVDLTTKFRTKLTTEQLVELGACANDVKIFINMFLMDADNGVLISDEQSEILDKFEMCDRVFITSNRGSGTTTICAAHALWLSMFHGQDVLLHASSPIGLATLMQLTRDMYENLPDWMRDEFKIRDDGMVLAFEDFGGVFTSETLECEPSVFLADGISLPDIKALFGKYKSIDEHIRRMFDFLNNNPNIDGDTSNKNVIVFNKIS